MPFAKGGARDESEPPPDDGSTARARPGRGRAAHDSRRRRGAGRGRQGGHKRGVRSRQPGRLPERRQQASVPDGERQRGRRDLQCEELEVTRADLLADLKKAIDGALTTAAGDPFEFGFPWATYDTQSHGAGLSVMASLYGQLSGTSTYVDWSGRWLGNIL